MLDQEIIDIAQYRLANANQCLTSAESEIINNDYKCAANRSYYAIFHAMRAVLALENKDYKKHSGVISEFRKNYILTGIFDKELSNIISQLFRVRSSCDYEDFYIISKEEVVEQLNSAKTFVKLINEYLEEILN